VTSFGCAAIVFIILDLSDIIKPAYRCKVFKDIIHVP
jgi:hypothetical protein